jgi:stage IV sporulation protein FB
MFSEPARTKYDLKWRMLGIPCRVNPFFWLIAAVLGWYDDIGVIELAIWIACVFISILVHELGHSLAALRFGAGNVHVVLSGLGGVSLSDVKLSSRQRIIELLCGPGAGFVLFGIVLLISRFTTPESLNFNVHYALVQLKYINLFWGLLNLIPIYPLDGGQIMSELLTARSPWNGLDITLKISMGLAFGIAVACGILVIMAKIKGDSANWLALIVFSGLASVNYQLYQSRFMIGTQGENLNTRNPWERDPDWWKK